MFPGGQASCWGNLYYDAEPRPAPGLLAPNEEFALLSTRMSHVCGLKRDGTIACWGCGVASDERSKTPNLGQPKPPPGQYEELVSGYWHNCALAVDGQVRCWGAGQPGIPRPKGLTEGNPTPPL